MEYVPVDEDKYVTMFLGFHDCGIHFFGVYVAIPESIRVQVILG